MLSRMELEFSGEIWFWKGPAPWHFVTVPEPQSEQIEALSAAVTYGWGMIPVTVRIGRTTWYTALWPRDGAYIVPLKANVRKAEGLRLGDRVTVKLVIAV
jgi:hypothetical protein